MSEVHVITCAQNATPVDKKAYNAITAYAKRRKAKLHVIPIRYRNPTSRWASKDQGHDWWAEELDGWIRHRRFNIGQKLTVLADIMTQPTANRPLNGYEIAAGAKSAIIGHPKLELKTVATPQNRMPKIISTTGCITRANYIPSKAGKIAEMHHVLGAAVVELEANQKTFHLRQLVVDRSGTIQDLDYPIGQPRPEAIVLGDLHYYRRNQQVWQATVDLISRLNPKHIVLHDVLDFCSDSHHDQGDTARFWRHLSGVSVADELAHTMNGVQWLCDEFPESKVVWVRSNHDEHLDRWAEGGMPRDIRNLPIWLQLKLEKTVNPHGLLVQHVYEKQHGATKNLRFLRTDESFVRKGVELGMHGHLGLNGARGSIASFGKIGVRSISGHSHTPGIRDGAYQVGTSSVMNMGYNKGPSSWLHTHCILWANGKRTLVNCIDGRFGG